jgi:hypothetical protein
MPRWLPRVVARLRRLAAQGNIRFTEKALQELAALGLDVDDATDVLQGLAASDSVGRLVSTETAEWLYVFRPKMGERTLYLKLVVRAQCVVISFHQQPTGDDQDPD